MARLLLTSDSPSATRRIGQRLARRLQPGDIILLQGDLGAGKTCLAQGIAKGLVVGGPVKSSAFVLVNEYQGRLKMYLADLYRLEDPLQVADLALEEEAADGVLVVEWPDRAWEEMPREYLLVRLEWNGERGRRLTLEPHGARYRELVQALAARTSRQRS
jgi:tRNA threonylcarbamoyladenosine biosynthesis protein TsaE